MTASSTSTDVFEFSSADPQSVKRAFLAHLERFTRQERDVPWQDAPAAFAAVRGHRAVEIEMTASAFTRAMETLLDSGEIHVERLDGGGNRLVAA